MAKRRILITGASGYLGSRIAKSFPDDDTIVVPATRADADLGDANAIRGLIETSEPTHVIHAAGCIAGSVEELTSANEVTSRNIGQAIIDVSDHIILTSLGSAAEYGMPDDDNPIDESKACNPVSAYGQSKLAATRGLQKLADTKGLRVNIVRPFNPIGVPLSPHQVLGAFVDKAVKARAAGTNIVKMGPLGAIRDFFYTEHLALLMQALTGTDCEGEIINACSGQPRRVRDLVNSLNSLEGGGFEIKEAPAGNTGTAIIGDPARMLTYVPSAKNPDIERILRYAWAEQVI